MTDPVDDRHRAARVATFALLLATLFWGCGFTWAKTAGEAINELSGAGIGAPLGPIWVLALRFLIAAVLWIIVFPNARRGWDRTIVRRSLLLGLLLSAGMILQHLGLDRTTEAVSAFLTSLTILFVPLVMTLALRKPPPAAVWFGVAVATAGVWLMTGASGGHFGAGEMLGLACAFAYSFEIIGVNLLLDRGNFVRVTAGQFFVVAIVSFVVVALLPRGSSTLSPARITSLMSRPEIGAHVALLAVLVSMGAFGIQFRFQPDLDPTRATLLYLVEPIFASAYAWIATGRRLSATGISGAAMILAANVIVEVLQKRKRAIEQEPAAVGPAVID